MLPKLCRYQKEAITWYDDCMLRYSSRTIYGKPETKPYHYIENPNLAPDLNQFSSVLGNLMSSLLEEAGSGGSLKKFAIGKVNFTESQDIYGLFQCTPDISKSDCVFCLNASIKLFDACCTGQTGGRIFMPSCTVRYEMFQFYSNTGLVLPSTPVSLPPPTAGAPPGQETDTAKGKKRNTLRIVIIVVPTIAFTCIVVAACLCMRMKKARRKAKNAAEIALTDSLCFDFETIRSSTNNFSDASKLGQGGFGAVYKGTLPSGQEIAVKRLFKNSEQGEREFKNEVSLMAKLQHRNLVRLLGYCIHRQERLLVLEFLQKGSLSNFIFEKRADLDWERRCKIISDIARGLLYLHEDSRLRIAHRDLKASNILLDNEMNAKISDFGLARLFSIDQTQEATRNVAGTYGYMDPEYVVYGRFSTKSDVFSFGVLVLEIVSGQKRSTFNNEETVEEDLLSYAWKNWRKGTAFNMVDPTLMAGPRIEIVRCIHIGLLCVQETVAKRPTMALVGSMLSSHSTTLAIPSKPALLDAFDLNTMTNHSTQSFKTTVST